MGIFDGDLKPADPILGPWHPWAADFASWGCGQSQRVCLSLHHDHYHVLEERMLSPLAGQFLAETLEIRRCTQ